MDERIPATEKTATTDSGIDIYVVRSFDRGMDIMASIVAQDESATFFSTPVWLEAWKEIYSADSEPLFVCANEDGTPVACAPLSLRRLPSPLKGSVIEFAGAGISDYADFVSVLSSSDRENVIKALVKTLLSEFRGNVFDLRQIPEHSPVWPVVTDLLSRGEAVGSVFADDACPVVDLSVDIRSHVSKSLLRELARNKRHLEARGELLQVDRVSENLDEVVERMIDLHHQRLKTKGMATPTSEVCAFIKKVIAAAQASSCLMISGVFFNSLLIAYELGFTHGRSVYLWNRAFDEEYSKYGVGKLSLLNLLRHATDEGYQVVDLLRGEEDYKERWATNRVHNYRAVFSANPTFSSAMIVRWIADWQWKVKRNPLVRSLVTILRRGRS